MSAEIDRNRLTKEELAAYDRLCGLTMRTLPREVAVRARRKMYPALAVLCAVALGCFWWMVDSGLNGPPGADVPAMLAVALLAIVVLPMLGWISMRDAREMLERLPTDYLKSIGFAARPKPPTIRTWAFSYHDGWEWVTYELTATHYPERYLAYAENPDSEPEVVNSFTYEIEDPTA